MSNETRDSSPPNLSAVLDADALNAPTDRRRFITRASALSLAIPGIGAALVGCSRTDASRDTATSRTASPAQTPQGTRAHNSDSRLDSAVLKGEHHGASSATAASTQGARGATFHRVDPTLPPRPANGRIQLHWRRHVLRVGL